MPDLWQCHWLFLLGNFLFLKQLFKNLRINYFLGFNFANWITKGDAIYMDE